MSNRSARGLNGSRTHAQAAAIIKEIVAEANAETVIVSAEAAAASAGVLAELDRLGMFDIGRHDL